MTVKVISNRRERYGLYEIGESQTRCNNCGSTSTRIEQVYEVSGIRRRKRKCHQCGRVFISDIPIVTAKNPVNPAIIAM